MRAVARVPYSQHHGPRGVGNLPVVITHIIPWNTPISSSCFISSSNRPFFGCERTDRFWGTPCGGTKSIKGREINKTTHTQIVLSPPSLWLKQTATVVLAAEWV